MPNLGTNKARMETKKNGYRSSPILKPCSDLPWLDLTTYRRLDHIGSGDDGGGCIIQSVYPFTYSHLLNIGIRVVLRFSKRGFVSAVCVCVNVYLCLPPLKKSNLAPFFLHKHTYTLILTNIMRVPAAAKQINWISKHTNLWKERRRRKEQRKSHETLTLDGWLVGGGNSYVETVVGGWLAGWEDRLRKI